MLGLDFTGAADMAILSGRLLIQAYGKLLLCRDSFGATAGSGTVTMGAGRPAMGAGLRKLKLNSLTGENEFRYSSSEGTIEFKVNGGMKMLFVSAVSSRA